MPKRYIEAERLKQHMAQKPEEWRTPDERWLPERDIALYIDTCPEADVVERKRGEWIDRGDYCVCTQCGHTEQQFNGVQPVPLHTPFCAMCGADMRGKNNGR